MGTNLQNTAAVVIGTDVVGKCSKKETEEMLVNFAIIQLSNSSLEEARILQQVIKQYSPFFVLIQEGQINIGESWKLRVRARSNHAGKLHLDCR